MNITRNSKGFTLIEIVIVIAIAALILAAILIFVPQAQKSQRDGQRKSDAAKILSKLDECASNNGGVVCINTTQFSSNYMSGINPPGSSSAYGYKFEATGSAPASGAACPTDATTSQVAIYTNSGNVQAVSVCLEGPNVVYTAGTN